MSLLRRIALFKRFPKPIWRPDKKPQHLIKPEDQASYPALASDFQALEETLMKEFRSFDNGAMRSQNQFHRQQVILILGGAVVTILGAAQVTLSALTRNTMWPGLAEAILAAILAGVAQYAQSVKAQQHYFSSRLKAEALRCEYFLFLARLRPYHDERTRQQRLRERVTEIKNSNGRQQVALLNKGRVAARRQRGMDSNEEEQQLWQLYYYQRYENQLTFYTSRRNEFQKAQAQATFLTITLMTLASIVSFLGSANVLSFSIGWSLMAVIFPVLAASLSNYESVYAFERHAKLYEDALVGLESVGMPLTSEGASITSLHKYASLIESVLKTEQGQWGQLISEVKGAAPPGITPNAGNMGD